MLASTKSRVALKKLPFTIQELVTASPCRSSDGILYTGNIFKILVLSFQYCTEFGFINVFHLF